MSHSHNHNALPVGTVLGGQYRVDSILGQGGFGIVYQAWSEFLQVPVAIKEYMPEHVAVRQDGTTVLPSTSKNADIFQWGLDAFLNEARYLARFQAEHPTPYIVAVKAAFEANGTAYMVTELVTGGSLKDRLQRGPMTEPDVRSWLIPLLESLDRMHADRVYHRDIKCDNILLRRDGTPVLIDFGAARQVLGEKSQSLTAVLTPGYAPVEQYSSSTRIGPYTDIYGLAATVYACLDENGKPPPEATARLLDDEMVPAQVVGKNRASPGFLKAIDQALEVRPESRPQDLASWRKLLEADQAQESAPKPPPTKPETAQSKKPRPAQPSKPEATGSSKRGRSASLIGVAVIVVALVVLAFQVSENHDPGLDPEDLQVGDRYTNQFGMEFVVLPAGEFRMGALPDINSPDWNGRSVPVTKVDIRKPFAMMTTEVTQGHWEAVMGENPSHFKGCGPDCPVEQVTKTDIKSFIRELNSLTGDTYRLPSESEWEYACRAGKEQTFCGSDSIDAVAWYEVNSDEKTHPVGKKDPNAWGLYDMSGNVGEIVEDRFHDSYEGHPGTESAWTSGDSDAGIWRGGSFYAEEIGYGLQSSRRLYLPSEEFEYKYKELGFRLVQDLENSYILWLFE